MQLRSQGAKAIAENIANLKCVSRLDISDNGECDVRRLYITLRYVALRYVTLRYRDREHDTRAVLVVLQLFNLPTVCLDEDIVTYD